MWVRIAGLKAFFRIVGLEVFLPRGKFGAPYLVLTLSWVRESVAFTFPLVVGKPMTYADWHVRSC